MTDKQLQEQAKQIADLKALCTKLDKRITTLEPVCTVRFKLTKKGGIDDWRVFYTSQEEFLRLKQALTRCDNKFGNKYTYTQSFVSRADLDWGANVNEFLLNLDEWKRNPDNVSSYFILTLFFGYYFRDEFPVFSCIKNADWFEIGSKLDKIAILRKRTTKTQTQCNSIDFSIYNND